MDSLPNEITTMILQWVDCPQVVRFVCIEWRDLLPGPEPGDSCDLVEYGNLDLLVWARDNEWPWEHDAHAKAAYGGYLEILKWLCVHNPPCYWDADICINAAWGGHLHILKWTYSQNPSCGWNMETLGFAIIGENSEMAAWIWSVVGPGDGFTVM